MDLSGEFLLYAKRNSAIDLSSGISSFPEYTPEKGCLPKKRSWNNRIESPKLSWFAVRSILKCFEFWISGGVNWATPTSQ